MKIFVTGASGFIGSAVVHELKAAGHAVVGLARSDDAAQKVAAMGAETHRGSLDDLESLREGVRATDGVVHCGFIHDFANYMASVETDRRALETFVDALAGTGKPLAAAFGAIVRPGETITEDDAPAPGINPRGDSEAILVDAAARGVRTAVVRLPPTVHGDGDAGFIPMIIGMAREKGVSAYLGDGTNRWPAVHRTDAARLFRLAIEKGEAGARYHAIQDEGVSFREIAETIGKGTGLPTRGLSPEEAQAHFGWMAPFAGADVPSSSALTRARLGWEPTGPRLIPDLETAPSYFAA